jgi:hypothetical protein
MTPALHRTVEALAVSAQAAIDWHANRRPYRLARAAMWERAAEAYAACAPLATMRVSRAEALAIAARHRAQSHKARAMCPTLTAMVWGGRA